MTLVSLQSLPRLIKLNYQVKKERERKVAEVLKSLEYLNNTRVFREQQKKEYEFIQANEKNLTDFEKSLMERFKELVKLEHKYLGEKIDDDTPKRFHEEIRVISSDCLAKLSSSKERATESLEKVMLYLTKFDMFEVLKMKTLNLAYDIQNDLGKFLRLVLEDQDRLFKAVAGNSLPKA